MGFRLWRVYRSTEKLSSNMRPFTNKHALLLAIGLMIPIILLLILHTTLGNVHPLSQSDWRCTNGPYSSTLFAYESILALALVVMAIISRHVPSVAGESSGVLYSASFIFFGFVFVGCIVILSNSEVLDIDPQAQALLITLAVVWCMVVMVGFIVLRKLFYINYSRKELSDVFLGKTDSRRGRSGSDEYGRALETGAQGSGGTSTPDKWTQQTSSNDNVLSEQQKLPYTEASDDPQENSGTRIIRMAHEEALDACKVTALDRQQRGLYIGETNGWKEYVDRKDGESFWINSSTYEVKYEDPTHSNGAITLV